jgi:hypothetical protein
MPTRPAPLSSALAAALCSCPSSALAEPPPIALEVGASGLEGCPDAATLARGINAILSRAAVSASPPVLPHATIHIDFSPSPRGARARLSLAGMDGAELGSRLIDHRGRACSPLEGPSVIVGALLVDVARPLIALSLPPEPPAPPPADRPPQPAARQPAAPALPAVEQPPQRSASARGEVAAAALWGLLPGAALGARSELRARGSGADGAPWAAWIAGRASVFPSGITRGPGPGGAFSAWTAGLGLCAPIIERARLEVDGCALASAGAMKAVGTGARSVREVTSLLALVEGDAGLRIRVVGPISLRLAAGLAAGRRPSSFSFESPAASGDGALVVHRPWPVALAATIGISVGQ